MKPGIVAGPARWKIVLTAGGLVLLATGCASSGSASLGTAASSTAASSSAPSGSVLCADAANLRTSLDKLRHVTVGPGTANEITTDLSEVQTALTTLVNNAHGQWQAQTSALNDALTTLKAAAGSLAASPGASTVSDVVSALAHVNTAARNLLAAVNTSCPSASPPSSA